jgi:hypothetical protein
VPRMLRSAPHLRRGALLVRGPSLSRTQSVGPGSAEHREERCTASGTRSLSYFAPPAARIPSRRSRAMTTVARSFRFNFQRADVRSQPRGAMRPRR